MEKLAALLMEILNKVKKNKKKTSYPKANKSFILFRQPAKWTCQHSRKTVIFLLIFLSSLWHNLLKGKKDFQQ